MTDEESKAEAREKAAKARKAFGDYLHALRNSRKETDSSFSVRGLAGKVGLSATYLSKIERGELPASDDAVYKLAAALGVSADEMFAKYGRIDPDLEKDIAAHEGPREMAAFLRTASGLSKERLEMYRAMIDAAEARNPEKGTVDSGETV